MTPCLTTEPRKKLRPKYTMSRILTIEPSEISSFLFIGMQAGCIRGGLKEQACDWQFWLDSTIWPMSSLICRTDLSDTFCDT